ncbi:MAG: efflux RND transporter periplasmic adaptor subunit [Nitrospirae bacterium]|uniref:RND family efflux transporter MFP subunit n=2 Tax=Nitrospirota TaxID=40117 RepID=A0A142BU36_9BACT|nr:efflux RND transporter periplasmic adaptor subunit [Candidatus Magnetobacterium casensis]AIM41297.1 RND family efflux transporter MFP subunit [Candidatus Magnetobacterium casensis]AMP41624.1 RND family efflux transporter MFP subunit [uncultured Nitrospirota bacterium]MBF0337233.1 efflux RND transporter periplasmic adaptor subunit [Nitrospirota bacterium]
MLRNRVFLLLAIIFAIIVLLASCEKTRHETTEKVSRPVVKDVTTEKVAATEVQDVYETSGTVRAENVTVLSARVMGQIKAIHVKESDTVRAGKVLIEIDDTEFSKKLAQAQAAQAEAKVAHDMAQETKRLADITFARYKRLYEEKVLTAQEFDEVDGKRNMAALSVQQAKAMIGRTEAAINEVKVYFGYTKITAPFDGVIVKKMAEAGTMAAPGMPLITMEQAGKYTVNVSLDERMYNHVAVGQKLNVRIDATGGSETGTVSEVSPQVDPAGRTFNLKISVTAKDVKSGFNATVDIPGGMRKVILVPQTAVVDKGQLTGVYTVSKEGVVSFRMVKAGKVYPDKAAVEVLSGLNEGDEVVVGGVGNAIDGGTVSRTGASGTGAVTTEGAK